MVASTVIRRSRQRARRRSGHWLELLVAAVALLGVSSAVLVAAGTAAVLGVYSYFARDLPTPEQIEEMTLSSFETTKIYDRSGQHLLWEVIDPQQGDRTIVPLSDIPVHMRNATIALEDRTFYTNPGGINFEGLARAVWNNLRGEQIQGGSSITAQLVRNVAMDPEERFAISYERKIKEAILSIELTRRYPGLEGRDRILEWYLNTVSYGKNAIGVEAAAKLYFGKHAKDLTLAEAAMLAAVPQYPAMNPIDNPDAARQRQALALQAMVNERYITPEEAEAAKNAPLGQPKPAEKLKIEAPHFVMYLLQVLEERYGRRAVYGGGLRVISTLDYDLQKQAEEIVKKNISGWAEEHQARNAAAVVIRPNTGEILAMVGSVDFEDKSIDGQVNMATSPRQPGSSFKPYTYAAAFEQGYAPATVVYDVRTAFPLEGAAPYEPENFDMTFHGPMMLRNALACSYNIPAVWLLDRIGIDSAVEMAHRMGITTLRDEQFGLALTLGAGKVTLLDHTYAYSVFANGGIMAGTPVPEHRRQPGFRELDPVSILKVTDGRGQVLDEFLGPTYREVISPQVAYLITNILSDNRARTPAYGPESPLLLSRPAAAKTGTTNSYVDAWTMGYNPQLAVGVWMGNSDYTPMTSMWGGRGAAPIWHDIMEAGLKDLPKVDFVEPPGIKWVTVDADSGLLPGPLTQRTVREPFIEGREPKARDNLHKGFAICKETGKLATPYCPADQLEHKVFPVYPSAVNEWLRTTNRPQPPSEYCDVHGPNLRASDASITSPRIFQSVKGVVQITGNARIPGFREYQLEFGEGLQPSQWFPIGGTHGNAVDNGVLENWDTASLANGLYTLRLTVRGSGDRQVTVPVTVDAEKPRIRIIHPEDREVYVKELDDYALLQVEAFDNMGIARVEYFVDNQPVGESRLAPFSLTWTLTMSDSRRAAIPPVPQFSGELRGEENGQPSVWRKTVRGTTTIYTHEVGQHTEGSDDPDEGISRTTIIFDQNGRTVVTPSGWGSYYGKDEDGQDIYREVHSIYAVAYDAAGNKSKSEPVIIYVEHRRPKKPAAAAGQ